MTWSSSPEGESHAQRLTESDWAHACALLRPVFGGSWQTVHRRFTEWTAARVWAKLHRLALDELGAPGKPDRSRCAIGSVDMRALKGDLTGPNPVDRGRTLEPLVRDIPPIRSPRGPSRRPPAELHADSGYDYNHLRKWLRSRNWDATV